MEESENSNYISIRILIIVIKILVDFLQKILIRLFLIRISINTIRHFFLSVYFDKIYVIFWWKK